MEVVYARSEVELVEKRRQLMRKSALYQRVWSAFRAEKSVVDVVVDLGVEPKIAEEQLHEYAAASRSLVLPGSVVLEMEELGFTVTRASFVSVVKGLLEAARGKGRSQSQRFVVTR